MKSNVNLNRRRFLSQTGFGLLAFAGLPAALQAMQTADSMQTLPAGKASANFLADVEIELYAQASKLSILPGPATWVMRYSAKLIKGPSNTLTEIPGSYLGPVMRFQTGQKIRISLINLLDEATIVHWHGLHVPAEMDGSPHYAIAKGERFVYEFEMLNRASMNIYHPHPHHQTARQFYMGMAGAMIVNDAEEGRLDLPSGEYEIPLVIPDKQFDSDNQLRYGPHMHERMTGYFGEQILVNGRPNQTLNLASRAYRFRLMNGSTARIYKLAWDDNTPITVIGTDGGLLETPVQKPYVMLAPAERLDLWVDFSGRKKGSQLILRSRPFSGALPAMAERMSNMMGGRGQHGMGMGGMHHGMSNDVKTEDTRMGGDYPILTVSINREVSDSPTLPSHLSQFKRYGLNDVANPKQPLPLAISEGPMSMLLNGRGFADHDVQDFERIALNSIQLLEIYRSQSGGHGGMGMGGMGMMSMAHPIHLHGQYFQILSRTAENPAAGYDTVKEGFVDNGFKDTVLVMPGERIKIIKPFQDFKGLFMYHCHNLEHEDMGMMREFSVE